MPTVSTNAARLDAVALGQQREGSRRRAARGRARRRPAGLRRSCPPLAGKRLSRSRSVECEMQTRRVARRIAGPIVARSMRRARFWLCTSRQERDQVVDEHDARHGQHPGRQVAVGRQEDVAAAAGAEAAADVPGGVGKAELNPAEARAQRAGPARGAGSRGGTRARSPSASSAFKSSRTTRPRPAGTSAAARASIPTIIGWKLPGRRLRGPPRGSKSSRPRYARRAQPSLPHAGHPRWLRYLRPQADRGPQPAGRGDADIAALAAGVHRRGLERPGPARGPARESRAPRRVGCGRPVLRAPRRRARSAPMCSTAWPPPARASAGCPGWSRSTT